jgi:hypothetical protein
VAHEHKPEVRQSDDPWLLVIPCQFGHIYPHSATHLGFASNGCGQVAKTVAALPGATITQDGSDGMNITFPVELFDQVAALVKPRRKRQLTPEQRAKLIEAGKAFQKKSGAQSDFYERPAHQTPQVDPAHVQAPSLPLARAAAELRS